MEKSQTTTTVQITWTTASRIRMTANVDLPEYGLTAGQVFYLARSSKNDGTYYIVVWNESATRWQCSCPATKTCRHIKLVNIDCKSRANSAQTHVERAREVCTALGMIPASQLIKKPAMRPQEGEYIAINGGRHVYSFAQATQAQALKQVSKEPTSVFLTANLSSNQGFSMMKRA